MPEKDFFVSNIQRTVRTGSELNCPKCGMPGFVLSDSKGCKECGFIRNEPHECSIDEKHHAEALRTWQEVREHSTSCRHGKYLIWKLDSGFLELSTQGSLVISGDRSWGYCWFCGLEQKVGTEVRWFPLDHVSFHETCVQGLGWQKRYLDHEQWKQLKRKFRTQSENEV